MTKQRSSEVDDYIARAAPFARPILETIREAFHEGHPGITETMKWSFPHFEYKGIVGSMAAFKNHVNYGFWKSKLLDDPGSVLKGSSSPISEKVTDVSQLPPADVLQGLVREAVRLNEAGIKVEKAPKKPLPPPVVPADLKASLAKNKAAATTFDQFAPSHQREYIQWIDEAKQEATRARRITQTLEWLAEGKSRNWKYEKKPEQKKSSGKR